MMFEILSTGIVYRNPKPHLRSRQAMHPALVDLGDGEMFCSFDIGEAVESLDYRTYKSRSMDGGETWEFEGRLFEDPVERPATHTMRTSLMADGSMVGFGARSYRDDPEEGLTNRETLGFVPVDLILSKSDDRGAAWSQPEVIDPPLVGPGFEICHSIIELASGRRLAPTSTWRGWNGELPNGEKALVLISDDAGKTWHDYGVTFDGGEAGILHWEQSVVPLGGDDLLAVAWAHDAKNGQNLPTPFSLSHDGGQTFSSPAATGLRGQTCKALHLGGGRILCVYRRDDVPGLWGNLSHLEGERWVNDFELALWGSSLSSSGMTGEADSTDELSALKFGFPSLQRTSEDEVMFAFWCLEGWACNIRWFRLRIGT